MKTFVKIDCGARYTKAMLRKGVSLPMSYECGNIVMFQKEQEGAPSLDSHDWYGPARILGFDGKVVWLLYQAVPVVTSVTSLRPANASEVLVMQVMSENMSQPFRQVV